MPGSGLPWELPSRGRVGMFALIVAEAAIFVIFVIAYLFYLGKSADAGLQHRLFAIEQPDHSLSYKGLAAR